MELISCFCFIGIVTTVIGGVSAEMFLKPISPDPNSALIPTITAHRNNDTVVLSFIRGKPITRCLIVVNGLKIGSTTTFKIGDIIEVSCPYKSILELYDHEKLLFFGII